jgi:membrane-bound ClpP family serine protease
VLYVLLFCFFVVSLLYLARRAGPGLFGGDRRAGAGAAQVGDDLAGMINEKGEALETFFESGTVLVRGEEWKACAMRGIIEKGVTVRVVGYEAPMVLLVETAAPPTNVQSDGDVR